jgi:hypothetical protein
VDFELEMVRTQRQHKQQHQVQHACLTQWHDRDMSAPHTLGAVLGTQL